MADVEMTTGTIILLAATFLMFVFCALGLVLFAGNSVFVLILISPVLGILATYSAATDRDMATFVSPQVDLRLVNTLVSHVRHQPLEELPS
ncbi:MAG: hypothetical protein P1Q69_05900 [Candidatus Thorarchaeota archaeon]|nr:hypothetical protein [Candidatus Thorarchaeota archaeon]